ncbi:hypothetical protein [Streptomyces sp. NPDC007264]|uniref:hypothetical protein n=1 Tax=Streptomyces sp. NPDC007264 TaxID=3364777 RepID=UPI0036DDDC48
MPALPRTKAHGSRNDAFVVDGAPVGGGWRPVLEGNATVVYQAELDPAVLLGDGPVESPVK